MTNVPGALVDPLAAWLPSQRWFAGRAVLASEVRVTSAFRLTEGDPELLHLMLAVGGGREEVRYQVPVGLRDRLPDDLGPAIIGRIPDGRIAYDGLRDPALAAALIRGIAAGRREGPLRFSTEPDVVLREPATIRVAGGEQSNTSIVFGDDSILKVLRRPSAGVHPDLEVPSALARHGSRLIAPPLGRIELEPGEARRGDGAEAAEPASTVLAILSRFFPGAESAWDLATASVARSPGDFTERARTLGQATATMHAELAEAFGTSSLPAREIKSLADRMNGDLDTALTEVPELRPYQAALRSHYAALADFGGEIMTQRIHGDYHLGQVLRTEDGWIVLDFEGEPSVPLDLRRAFGPPMRDVAGMLRSLDYAARQHELGGMARGRQRPGARSWTRRCQDAFRAGYASTRGSDPGERGPLLPALMMQKAVYEAVYEARHRPDWLPIPLTAIAEGSR